MRELILMRHAEATSAAGATDDFQRPLTNHGRELVLRAAHAMAVEHGAPQLIICSPALRTLQTAELLLQTQSLPPAVLRTESSIYLATVTTLQRLVRQTDDAVMRLLLIGHNPGISQLLQTLTPGHGRRGLATAQFACLPLPMLRWAELP
jgi:phosphohistidine phosphatase